jgi:hypothetical protein
MQGELDARMLLLKKENLLLGTGLTVGYCEWLL